MSDEPQRASLDYPLPINDAEVDMIFDQGVESERQRVIAHLEALRPEMSQGGYDDALVELLAWLRAGSE